MSRTERRVLTGIAVLGLLAIALWAAHHQGWGEPPAAVVPGASGNLPPIDLNRAPWQDLTLLPGIGEAKAKRIVEHRERIGGFRYVGELDQVSGIGPSLVERIRPHVIVGQP